MVITSTEPTGNEEGQEEKEEVGEDEQLEGEVGKIGSSEELVVTTLSMVMMFSGVMVELYFLVGGVVVSWWRSALGFGGVSDWMERCVVEKEDD